MNLRRVGSTRPGRFGAIAVIVALATGAAIGVSEPLVTAGPAGAAVLCGGRIATIVGTNGFDTLNGTSGNDVIAGLGGNDAIVANGGNDVVCGGDGDDFIYGGSQQDTLYPGPGVDTVYGGLGTDEVSYSASESPVIVDLGNQSASGEGTDHVFDVENATGSPWDDYLFGDDDDNQLVGLDGNDTLIGLRGDDVLADNGTDPRATNDFLGGAGDDISFGGVATDIADFTDLFSQGAGPVIVDLAAGTATGQGTDRLSGMDDVNGSPSGDTITGDGQRNTLYGAAGDDVISGGGGDDTLAGSDGDDRLDGEKGDDTASFAGTTAPIVANLTTGSASGEGTDALVGIEALLGGGGNDRLTGNAAKNTIEGGPGNDAIDGQGGTDWAVFDSATQPIVADLRAGTATGAGNDTLVKIENLRGGRTADELFGDDRANTLVAGFGDELEGRGGDDVFESSEDPSNWVAYVSYASAPGGVSVDTDAGTVTGAAGNDTLRFAPTGFLGSNFDDRIACSNSPGVRACDVRGAGGNDTLLGTPNDDRLEGGTGNDTLDGKAGGDTVNYEPGAPVNVNFVTGKATGQGNDTIVSVSKVVGSRGNDTIVGAGGTGCLIYGLDGDDRLSSAGDGCEFRASRGNDTITGSNGKDLIEPDDQGTAYNDIVHAGGGDDVIRGDGGNDLMDGGDGTDLVDYAPFTATPLQVNLANGSVTGAGTDTLVATESFRGGTGNDTIRGSDGPDVIDGYSGNDTIIGGPGDDRIDGNAGNDWIDGNAGNDVITPRSGDDTVYGEDGIDTVSYASAYLAVTVSLANGQATGEGSDRLTGVENVTGSNLGDVLTGDAGPNVIDGGSGTDTCDGNGGADTLVGCP